MIEGILEGKDKYWINKYKIGNEGLVVDLIDDFDIEEVLKEFDFLVIVEDGEGVGEVWSLGDGIEWVELIMFLFGGGKLFIMGFDDVLLSVLGFGDFVDLMVINDVDYSYDLFVNKDVF